MTKNDILNQILTKSRVTLHGWTPLEKPLTLSYYKTWLEKKQHGTMKYLEEHLELKAEQQQLLKTGRSAIVVAQNYWPHPHPSGKKTNFKIAKYAQGVDYHFWLKEKLEEIVKELKSHFPEEDFLSFVPLLIQSKK